MASPLDPRLTALINTDLLFAEPERFSDVDSWHEHLPFALVLMDMLEPRSFVELGVHKGDSYFAFCQAVKRLGLPTKCYGVDTWQGDEHTRGYDDSIYAGFKSWHDAHYGDFSTPIRGTFDEALANFDDGSIDLLHIDGFHTYDAVKHDFETWLPKISARGVVLFHDISVRTRMFGVWHLWEQITPDRAHFEFRHGNGLGILAVGSELPPKFRAFLDCARDMPDAVRGLFEAFGQRVARLAMNRNQAERIAALEQQRDELQGLFPILDQFRDELASLSAAHTALIGQRDSLGAELAAIHQELVATRQVLTTTQQGLASAQAELHAVYESRSWKITAPLRRLLGFLRRV
jgi:hypothetical protein